MWEWFDEVGYHADIAGLRRDDPEVGWRDLRARARPGRAGNDSSRSDHGSCNRTRDPTGSATTAVRVLREVRRLVVRTAHREREEEP
jgi:hypothetical protein